MFSDHNYNLVWGKRLGFAKVAIDAKVVSHRILFCYFVILAYSVSFVSETNRELFLVFVPNRSGSNVAKRS